MGKGKIFRTKIKHTRQAKVQSI